MQILLKQHREFLKRLVENNVEFILIGGYAVIYHGYNRNTDDLDVWLKPHDSNKEKFLSLLIQEGIMKEDIDEIRKFDFSTPQVFFLGEQPERIDFLTKVQGLNFDEAQKLAAAFEIDGCRIPVLNFDHLVISKVLSNRPRDKSDLDALQKISQLKKKTGE